MLEVAAALDVADLVTVRMRVVTETEGVAEALAAVEDTADGEAVVDVESVLLPPVAANEDGMAGPG